MLSGLRPPPHPLICVCLSAARGGGGRGGVQLEEEPSLQPHGLPGALPDLHGGLCVCVCVFTL